jgi:protein-tyrosine phosphatase
LVLANRRYRFGKSRARRVVPRDLEVFDLILVMDSDNMNALLAQSLPSQRQKLAYFMEFAPELGLTEVPDPYFGDAPGFERVLDLCEAGADGVIKRLRQTL